MGFFSFLFDKKDAPKRRIPTVNMPKELPDEFRKAFRLHVSAINCFSNKEIENMLNTINSIDNAFINLHGWRDTVYDEYFRCREWTWPLLEEWRDMLIEEDEEDNEVENIIFDKIVTKLKIADIRDVLHQYGAAFERKMKKSELVEVLARSVPIDWLETKNEQWIALRRKGNIRLGIMAFYHEFCLGPDTPNESTDHELRIRNFLTMLT